MLLNAKLLSAKLLNTVRRSLRRRGDDERGNAMIAVVGLIAVTSLITVTITTATVQALGFTSLTRAGVQSNAAAESGVDAMLAALTANACPATGELSATQGSVNPSLGGAAASAPFYAATVAQRISTEAAWTPGCPSDASTQIRIQSTGFAASQGVAQSASANDASAVQAVYEWKAGASVAVKGAAIYSYGTPGLGNNFELLSFLGSSANIIVVDGDIICTNSVDVEGDIVAAAGNIELNNTCSAGGNVWASGTVTINSGTKTIGGNVIAAGTGQSSINKTGATIGGGVYVGGSLVSGGTCSSAVPNQEVTPADPCGDVLSTGANRATYNSTSATAPAVASWVDVDFVEADWISGGWAVETYTGPCTIDNKTVKDPQVAAFSNYGPQKTVIDMSGCTEGVIVEGSAGLTITMKTDLTFILPMTVRLGSFTVSTESNVDRALRFITPDPWKDDGPTTSECGLFTIANQNVIAAPVAIMVYTPCDIENTQKLDWRGQYYGNKVSFSQNSSVTYVPIGIPGFDLGNGLGGSGGGGGPASAGSPGDLLEYTDIDLPA